MFAYGTVLREEKRATRPCRITSLSYVVGLVIFTLGTPGQGVAQNKASDPGVRGGPAGAGPMISGLSTAQQAFFGAGQDDFNEVQSVQGTVAGAGGGGLGPRFNAEGCGQCHAQPGIGGTSPAMNPQFAAAADQGATNQIPDFLSPNGPVREARFPFASDLRHPDGGVHDLFTITGRGDAPGCSIAQPNFRQAEKDGNVIFRIPTPVFGAGLIESIPETAILNNMNANQKPKRNLGIAGRPNTSGNDGTITRFGWKAQNKSMEMFSGEAYNVEMGITNEIFPNEREEAKGCLFNNTPEDHTNFDADGTEQPSDVIRFEIFMRFLDQPQPAAATASTTHGAKVFNDIGCTLCHNPSFTTGPSSVSALGNITANLYSDLLLHHMGPKLADDISQGAAGGDEFRTAPLWGLGQRIFFLHDGRTADLVRAIHTHASGGDRRYPDSEANEVIENYKKLPVQDQQDLLNFLRSL
jgi:CxxC motif-containing protein (DUF1111 family)